MDCVSSLENVGDTSQEPSDIIRRKSVENLLMSSHEVLGSSINSSLPFGNMMLPTNSCQQGQGTGSSTGSLEPRSHSPSASPHSSPRPSPRQHHKRDSSRTEMSSQATPCSYKDGSLFDKCDNLEDSISRSSDSSQLTDLGRSGSQESSKDRKDASRGTNQAKKKSSWYSALYPTYKSRSEDFKRIFKDVPPEERLVVDYSCALQKDILVHGRLYVSQNYLCFYANIFRWETQVSLRWKDVTAITKEKTALVIPNAIVVCTPSERHFLTSFGARDKTYLMLFRVWQNALMDQPMSMQEMWQWVHTCYGDELGLTSDDEDYIPPATEDDKLAHSIPLSDSFSEDCLSLGPGMEDPMIEAMSLGGQPMSGLDLNTPCKGRLDLIADTLPTDMSDTTESDAERTPAKLEEIVCTSQHEGRKIIRSNIPIHIDQLFTLLFTSSKFFLDFHTARNTTDIVQSAWQQNPETGYKERTVSLTLALTQAVGPKSTQVTENQMMLPCSKPGCLYAIDMESSNSGIPYADSFYVTQHYCITRTGENESCLAVYSQIKYRKSVWGLVKSFIEKNTWSGLDDFYQSLTKALLEESLTCGGVKKKSRRRRRGMAAPIPEELPPRLIRGPILARHSTDGDYQNGSDLVVWLVLTTLVFLVLLNAFLYYKLWVLEAWSHKTDSMKWLDDLEVLKSPPTSHEEWLLLLQKQEMLHKIELQKWQQVLQAAVELLRKTEKSLSELQISITPLTPNKVVSIITEYADDPSQRNAAEL